MKYDVKDVNVTVAQDETLVAGSVKIHYAEFAFDESWGEYTKIAVFKRGQLSKEQVLKDNKCEIPWEVIEKRGTLQVGIYGITSTKTRPTLWAPGKTVHDGTEPGDVTREPTPDIYQQLVKMLTVGIDDIEGGHRVTFHDAEGEKTFDVADGKNGKNGDTPYIKNGNWWIGTTDTGIKAEGRDYVLTEPDKVEIAEDAAMLSTVGRYATVPPTAWSDDTDLLSRAARAQRIAYKTSANGMTPIIDHNWGAPTDAILSEDWQTFEATFTYAPTNYTGGLWLVFYGGKNETFCHPYDIADVKLWRASDADRTNLFPEDIAKLNWWWHHDTESCLEVNRFSVAYDDDGHKYIHVWRQHTYMSPNGTVNGNMAYLRAATGVKLTVGETYVLSVRMRSTCKQHTAIAECEGIRDHSATVVSPVPNSTAVYLNSGMRAFGQRIGELMFKADTKPTDDITVAIQASRGQGTGVIINTVMPEITGALDAALLNTIGSGVIS